MSASKFGTYDQIGQVEDISDIISNIAPTETPFQSMISKGKTKSMAPEWQEDDLDAPVDNAHIQGNDAPAANQVATTIRSNYVQQFIKTVQVTDLARLIDTYGRDDELSYQLSKKGKEVKRDLERALVGVDQAKVAGDMSSTARRMASVYQLIDSSVTLSNSGTGRALTEELWLDTLETLYNANGEATQVMIPPAHARRVATFAYRDAGASGYAPQRMRELSGDTRSITNVIDVYEGPHGKVEVRMNRWMKKYVQSSTNAEHLFFNPSNFKLVTLQPWTREELAKTGTSEKHLIKGAFTLMHANVKLSGRLSDLNNS